MDEYSSLPELNRRRFLQLMGLTGAGVALSACAGSGSTATTTTEPFPIGAAAKAKTKPVPVTFWNSMTEANASTLVTLTKRFNASQGDVKVTLVDQTSYSDTMTAYTAAAGSNNLPDLVQIENIDLQLMIDSRTIVPAGDAVAADNYDLSGLLPSAVEFFRVDGTLWAMPFNESTQVMYYDTRAFEKAGLDPTAPPRTLDEYRSACEAIVSKKVAKYGTSLKLTPSNFECWISQAGQTLVNNGNGRAKRATEVTFGGAAGEALFDFYEEMFRSKLAQATPGTGPGDFDNLYAILRLTAPMAIETSAALGTIIALLPSLPQLSFGLGPLPAPAGPGGVPYGGAGLYMVKSSPPERQDGSWQFIKFLLEAGPMASWSLGTGYIPITASAVMEPSLSSTWAKHKEYRVAYDQVLETRPSIATAGAVCGPLAQLETDIMNGITAISSGTSASKALAGVVSQSNSAISSYNSRV
jgi:sn-glycerol 3-phosphate transport system substrate-binding protein